MALVVTPERELIFYGPFNTPSIASVELLNNSEDRLAYKFRTNITGRYIVKPNNGFLNPHEKASVQITLNPSKEGEAQDKKTHQFRIQWTAMKQDEIEDPSLFSNKAVESRLAHITLICLFHERPTPSKEEILEDELQKAKQVIDELEKEKQILMARRSPKVFGIEFDEKLLLISFIITLFIGIAMSRVLFKS